MAIRAKRLFRETWRHVRSGTPGTRPPSNRWHLLRAGHAVLTANDPKWANGVSQASSSQCS